MHKVPPVSSGRRKKPETFEKCSILFKFKPPARGAYAPEGKANPPPNFGGLLPRTIFRTYGAGTNTYSILRIKLKLLCEQNVELDTEIGQKGAFCKCLNLYLADAR